MGKFENIPELRGTENYYEWRRQTEQLLLGQGVYNHVSNGTNPFDYVRYALACPCPLIPIAPTPTEQEALKTWFKDDGLAKSIILRKINSSVLTLIPDNVSITAREVWNTLAELYDRSDVSLQFSLRAQISTFQMKGASDAEKYVALHTHANDRLARMGARPSEADTIYALLRGLPKTGIWPVIRKNIETELERSEQSIRSMGPSLFNAVPVASQSAWPPPANTPVTPRNPFAPSQQSTNPFLTPSRYFAPQYGQHPVPLVVGMYTFKHAAQTIIREAMQMMNEGPTPGPGSEYANAAVQGGRGEVNPLTGLRKTKNNPSGTACTTPICVGRKRTDHDWSNCFQQGGGKAGQAPWQRDKTQVGGTQVAAVVAQTGVPATSQAQSAGGQTSTQIAAAAVPCPLSNDCFRDLSCAVLEELSEGQAAHLTSLATVMSSTILDSGTTTHLIRDPSFFWTFTRDSTVSMRTANQGSLGTEGHGDCVAILKLGDKRIRLRLQGCLYAPNAVANLLSVGRMVEHGWEVRFKGGPNRCELLHSNESLGHVNMRGQLCFLNVEFVRPSGISGTQGWDMPVAT